MILGVKSWPKSTDICLSIYLLSIYIIYKSTTLQVLSLIGSHLLDPAMGFHGSARPLNQMVISLGTQDSGPKVFFAILPLSTLVVVVVPMWLATKGAEYGTGRCHNVNIEIPQLWKETVYHLVRSPWEKSIVTILPTQTSCTIIREIFKITIHLHQVWSPHKCVI